MYRLEVNPSLHFQRLRSHGKKKVLSFAARAGGGWYALPYEFLAGCNNRVQ
jgi:hypothetical protein